MSPNDVAVKNITKFADMLCQQIGGRERAESADIT